MQSSNSKQVTVAKQSKADLPNTTWLWPPAAVEARQQTRRVKLEVMQLCQNDTGDARPLITQSTLKQRDATSSKLAQLQQRRARQHLLDQQKLVEIWLGELKCAVRCWANASVRLQQRAFVFANLV